MARPCGARCVLALLALLPLAAAAASCETLKELPRTAGGGRVPYARLWACAPRTARPVLGVAALAWLAALLLVMATVCNTFLVPAVEWAAAAARIPPPLAGVTLLAVAAGAPDLATAVAAVLAGDSAGPVDGGLAAAVAVGSVQHWHAAQPAPTSEAQQQPPRHRFVWQSKLDAQGSPG